MKAGRSGTQRSAALTSFHAVTVAMVASLDLDETLKAVAQATTAVLNADIAAIFLLDDATGELVSRAVHGGTSRDWDTLRLGTDKGLNARSFKIGELQRIDDLSLVPRSSHQPAVHRILAEEPLGSAVTAPIRRRGALIGTIGVYRREVKRFDAEEEFLLALLADQAGIALDNALTHAELQATRERLQSVVEASDAIWNAASFDDVADRVIEQATRLLPEVACLIGVVPADQPHLLEFVAGTPGWAAGIVNSSHVLAETNLSRVVIAEGRVIESDSFSKASPVAAQMTSGTGIDTVRLIPLGEALPDGRSGLGVLGFYREGSHPFSAVERELMDGFGRRVSVSLQRAELLRLAEITSARLQLAIDVAADLSASLDTSEVIRTVLVRAVSAGHADRAVLLRIDGGETVVEDFFDVSGARDIIGYRHLINRQPLMQASVTTRAPVVGGRYDVSQLGPQLGSVLAEVLHTATIPLVLEGEVTAVLVLSRRSDQPFLAGDVALFQLIGNQAVLALRNARLFAQAKEVTRAQSDFLNMAAHELRTPLSVIAGYVSMMEDGTLGAFPPAWTKPLETLRSKSAELEALIGELLIASRLEAGTMPFRVQEIDLRVVASAAVERVGPRARLLGARVDVRLPTEEILVEADPEQVGRILDNLLNNALSYSSGIAEVTVTVRGGGDPTISVRDRGHGVPTELQERIFERFFRVDDPSIRHVPGTGLGLYISRQLAERMGGRLVLKRSAPGRGSTFTVRLPPAGRGSAPAQ